MAAISSGNQIKKQVYTPQQPTPQQSLSAKQIGAIAEKNKGNSQGPKLFDALKKRPKAY